jgi:hypothetical protein
MQKLAVMLLDSSERQGIKVLGSKFIKQDGSNSADLRPKAEPQEQSGFPYIPFRVGYRNGVQLVPHMVTCCFIGHFNLGAR